MPNRILANNRPLELSPRAFSALLRFQRPAFLAFEPRQCRELCHGVQGLWAQLAPEFPELLFGRVSCVAATGILGEGACSVASAHNSSGAAAPNTGLLMMRERRGRGESRSTAPLLKIRVHTTFEMYQGQITLENVQKFVVSKLSSRDPRAKWSKRRGFQTVGASAEDMERASRPLPTLMAMHPHAPRPAGDWVFIAHHKSGTTVGKVLVDVLCSATNRPVRARLLPPSSRPPVPPPTQRATPPSLTCPPSCRAPLCERDCSPRLPPHPTASHPSGRSPPRRCTSTRTASFPSRRGGGRARGAPATSSSRCTTRTSTAGSPSSRRRRATGSSTLCATRSRWSPRARRSRETAERQPRDSRAAQRAGEMRPRCSRSAAGRLSDARSRPTPLHRNPPPTPHPPSPALSPLCGRLARSPRASRPRPPPGYLFHRRGSELAWTNSTRCSRDLCALPELWGAQKSKLTAAPIFHSLMAAPWLKQYGCDPSLGAEGATLHRCLNALPVRAGLEVEARRAHNTLRTMLDVDELVRSPQTYSLRLDWLALTRPSATATARHRTPSRLRLCAHTQARARNLQRHRPHARPLARAALDPEQVLEQVLERRDGLRRRRRLVVAAVFAAPLPRAAEQAGRPRAAAPLRRGEGLLSRAWLVRGESDLPLACDQERVLSRAYRACFSSARVVGDKALAIQGIKTARKDDEQAAITAAVKQWVQRGATPALRELSARCRCSRAALELQPLFSARQPVAPQPGSRGIISCTAPPILASTLAMVKRLQRAGNRLPLELWRVCRRGRARSVESEQARLNR